MNNQNKPLPLDQFGKLPPQDVGAEEQVLSALLVDPESIIKVINILPIHSFYKSENSTLYGVIRGMYERNIEIDITTVTGELNKLGILTEVGGIQNLMRIFSLAMSSIHIIRHAKMVYEHFARRKLILMASEVLNNAYDLSQDVTEVFDYAQDRIETIQDINTGEAKSSRVATAEAINEISESCSRVEQGLSSGIPTPFSELNAATGGWKAPMLVVLGARPSVGKTTYAFNFAVAASDAGFWVSFYTYEMLSPDLIKLIITMKSGVRRTKIRDGKVNPVDWSGINSVIEYTSDLKINWYDDPTITAQQIRANTHREKKKGMCDLVIVDYLQLVPVTEKLTREQGVAKNSRTLKGITTGLKVPVIALSQLNRSVEARDDPKPKLSDLRESGSLEQDADLVSFIYNITENTNGEDVILERRFNIAKHRNGKLGDFRVYADSQMTRLSDSEYSDGDNCNFLENDGTMIPSTEFN